MAQKENGDYALGGNKYNQLLKYIFKKGILTNPLKRPADRENHENLLPLVSKLVPDWASAQMEELTLIFIKEIRGAPVNIP